MLLRIADAGVRCRGWRNLFAMAALLAVSGCGGVEPKDGLVRAYGYVTLDGEPLSDAQVTFDHPNEAETFGRTDSSGYYDVWFTRSQRGAFAGPNAVWFTTRDPDLGTEEVVPKQYRSGQSALSVDVTEDGSPYNFDLVSADTAGTVE